MKRKPDRMSALVLALLFAAVMLTGCGGAQTAADNGAMADTVGQTEPMSAPQDGFTLEESGFTTLPQPPSGAKLIYTSHINLETMEFSSSAAALTELVSQHGGFFEQQEMSNRGDKQSGSYAVRIPTDRLEEFLTAVAQKEVFQLTYQSTSCENVSEVYGDIENRMETLHITQERLQELLTQAESMEDIIAIESKLAEIEAQLDALSGEKNHYDNLIDYATIYVQLQEVSALSGGVDPSMGQRLSYGFQKGLQNFAEGVENLLVWVVSNLILLLLVAVLVVVVVLLVRKQKKKKKAAQMPPAAE